MGLPFVQFEAFNDFIKKEKPRLLKFISIRSCHLCLIFNFPVKLLKHDVIVIYLWGGGNEVYL